MSSPCPPPRTRDNGLCCGEVIDLASNKADDNDPAQTLNHELESSRFASLFGGVGLTDLELGDRLGARRDGGQEFQVRSVNNVICFGG